MIFRQLFNPLSSTYTYLLGDEKTKGAIVIDSVLDDNPHTLQTIKQLELCLEIAIDTHTHADHITGMGALRHITGCSTMMGEQAVAQCLSSTFKDGDQITLGDIKIEVIYSPGHTDDSYSFYVASEAMLFTGDTLLIGGTGRTDFQNGDAAAQYDSLHERLLTLPINTLVYPGHDYRGNLVSTIGAEKRHNPRLQIANKKNYTSLMNSLKLASPELMDIAVTANQACGNLSPENQPELLRR